MSKEKLRPASEQGHVHIIAIAFVIIGIIALVMYLGTMGEQAAAKLKAGTVPQVDQAAAVQLIRENEALKHKVEELEQKLIGQEAYCEMLRHHDAKLRGKQPGKRPPSEQGAAQQASEDSE